MMWVMLLCCDVLVWLMRKVCQRLSSMKHFYISSCVFCLFWATFVSMVSFHAIVLPCHAICTHPKGQTRPSKDIVQQFSWINHPSSPHVKFRGLIMCSAFFLEPRTSSSMPKDWRNFEEVSFSPRKVQTDSCWRPEEEEYSSLAIPKSLATVKSSMQYSEVPGEMPRGQRASGNSRGHWA